MAIGSFMFVTIDATDAASVAAFWAKVLGTELDDEMDDGRFVFLKGREGLPVVCIQRVPEGKSLKNRVHLDLSVEDLEIATAEVLALGGSWPDGQTRELEGFRWRTLADPEGNEFDIAMGG
jgi:predicted enzyme related to lactoylglutathione lyase